MFGKGFLYAVYDNGEKIFEGTANEVAERFKMSPKSVNTYSKRNSKFENKYDIKVTGRTQSIQKPYVPKAKQPRKSKDEEYLEYLETHLRMYGNTSTSKDPEKYLLKLREKGIECKVRKVYENYSTSKLARYRKKVNWYILERVNAERASQSI